ncbi:TldD/PmbA family protein [Oharaeibacter diazotrophicus]|uniref:Microcin-processing peptidase 1 n=1 Tax=Oharaeibacter diazotrophicus TaxID=1920512 RepID=A0A4R6RBD1_9HYPH|nr:metallopeptidase TldD-related protein [Oharaeibacter diazotrophicus]TDP83430.1 microcin-processing peptidase 1 [Oharaeibacter diazotrophicus]BBE72263.1 peptidase PmbA [Pleomorphomonas sp. SM30]
MSELVDLAALTAQAHRLVEAALRAGADAADAVASRSVNEVVSLRLGKVEKVEHSENDDFGLRVFVGERNATVSATLGADVGELAERVVAMAKAAPPDRFAGLADRALLARDVPDLDLCDGVTPDVAALSERARACEDAARAVAGVANSNGAGAYWSRAGAALVTSTGFSGGYETSRHGHSVSVIAGEGTAMERDWDSSGKVHLADLEAPDVVGRRAGERTVRRLNPRRLDTRLATIVYDPRVSTSIVGAITGAISGAAIARGTSFLKNALGEAILPAGFTISDDPRRPRGLASRPFDGEGLPSLPLDLVVDGVLQTWILDGATARELGLASNGRAARGTGSPSPSATNVLLHPGDVSPEELIRQVGTGLYVTDFIGHGTNLVTGDYSRGATGFWIENGELTYPVSEITVAGRLPEMFRAITRANDIEWRGSYTAPTLAIEGLTIAGR